MTGIWACGFVVKVHAIISVNTNVKCADTEKKRVHARPASTTILPSRRFNLLGEKQ
jgi:hypothetical protein